jgi:hypothetical protein
MKSSRRAKRALGDRIEEEAALVAGNLEGRLQDDSLPSSIEQQIALTLEQLQQVRALHKDLERNLLQLECMVDTDILQLEPRPLDSVDQHREQRFSLKNRLLKIDAERRALARVQLEKEQALHEKLLTLLRRLSVLRG